MPERFDLFYIASDGEKRRPVMIHRVVFGSIERFIAILTEHFAGAFPLWLSPVQVKVLPLADRHAGRAAEILRLMADRGIRAEMDDRNEKIGYKIREAQLQKIPYMLIIGDKELEEGTVSVRARSGDTAGSVKIGEFLEKLDREIELKTAE
jgi:threonyl-tRNA synthetase